MKLITILFILLGFLLSGFYATWQMQLLQRGFSVQNIATLIGVSTMISLLIDVPAGVWADRIGHKKSVIFGLLLYVFGFFGAGMNEGALYLASGVILITIGGALIEGALESWSADLQKSQATGISAKNFMGLDQAQRFGMITGAIFVPFIASTLFESDFRSWAVYGVLALVVLVFAFFIPKGIHDHSDSELKKPAIIELTGHMKEGSLWMLAGGALFFGLSDATVQISFWPRMKEFNITEPVVLGFIQSGMSLSRIIGLQFWKRIKISESVYLPAICLAFSGIAYGVFSLASSPISALAMWFIRIAIFSAYFSSINSMVQKLYVKSGWRATIVSGLGTVAQLGTIGMTFSIGKLFSLSTVQLSFLGAGFALVSSMFYYLRAARRSAS